MSSIRITSSSLLRTSRASTPRVARQFRALPATVVHPTNLFSQFRGLKHDAAQPTKPSKIYTFQDIKAHLQTSKSESKSKPFVLIDSREPGELQSTGTIPGSLNVPVTSKPDSFFISAEEFEDRFGFERPGKDTEVVFYCKAGVRSRAAAELAKAAGWTNVSEYPGSWLDWERNGGEKQGGR